MPKKMAVRSSGARIYESRDGRCCGLRHWDEKTIVYSQSTRSTQGRSCDCAEISSGHRPCCFSRATGWERFELLRESEEAPPRKRHCLRRIRPKLTPPPAAIQIPPIQQLPRPNPSRQSPAFFRLSPLLPFSLHSLLPSTLPREITSHRRNGRHTDSARRRGQRWVSGCHFCEHPCPPASCPPLRVLQKCVAVLCACEPAGGRFPNALAAGGRARIRSCCRC